MKTRLSLLFALALFGLLSCQKDAALQTDVPLPEDTAVASRATVVVPAGSVDALAAAIQQAGNGGTVILAAGEHTESGTVLIPHKITLLGEEGAILRVNTAINNFGYNLDPAIHVLSAPNTKISNIDLRTPGADPGNTGILIQNSHHVRVEASDFDNYQFSILVEKSDNCNLIGNTVSSTSAWLGGPIFEAHGIVVINGKNAKVNGNTVTGAFFGIWACDKNGHYSGNNMYGNYIGLILCKVPANALTLPDGAPTGAQFPATNCKVQNNNAHNNFDAGYLVIDGANGNVLLNNAANNNGTYDIELVGDSYRFGFLTPTSANNLVNCGSYNNITVKDCGVSNTVIGGNLVDNNLDPCD